MIRLVVLVAVAVAALLSPWGRAARGADGEPLTGAAVDRALRDGISLVREQAEARETLNQLAATQRVACWLDRRLDPSSRVSLQLQHTPLLLVFEDVAGQLDAACGRLGDTVLIGRAGEIDPLLTQSELLASLLKSDRSIPVARRQELARRRTITWSDLDRPTDVLERTATAWGLTIKNLDVVPHDLWAEGTAAGVNAAEALSLVLGQFELSFTWDPGAKGITIVPQAQGVTLERSHRPQKMSPADAEGAIRAEWPALPLARRGATLLVTATTLQHDAIARRIGAVDLPSIERSKPVPLDRRQFARVKILRKPAGSVLATLVTQGLPLEYDAAALASAGVDLQTPVTLDLEQVSAEELVAAICDQAGLTYVVENDQIFLRAKPAP